MSYSHLITMKNSIFSIVNCSKKLITYQMNHHPEDNLMKDLTQLYYGEISILQSDSGM